MPERGAMVPELKTQPTGASVSKFINTIEDDERRRDCRTLVRMMQEATQAKPKMWGPSIVGFGDFEYVNSTRKPQQWFQCGFSPRKQALTLYLMGGYPKDPASAKKLGKFKTGASCLYIRSLDDVHVPTLRGLIAQSLDRLKAGRIDYSK
jgi:Domain of unknown function (DU1801)